MGKFIVVTDYDLTYKLRRYVSSKKGSSFFMTEVNLRENHFEIFFSTGRSYFSYLRIIHKPKRVLNTFGYSLDDFLKYESVEEFLDSIAKYLKKNGNDIDVRCSRYFLSDFDVEIL